MRFPRNGYELLQARRKGLRPRGMVMVTDCKEKKADCQLIITPGLDYDFSMLRGLDVFFIMEDDWLKWHFKAYRKWSSLIQEDISAVAKNLFVIPSYLLKIDDNQSHAGQLLAHIMGVL